MLAFNVNYFEFSIQILDLKKKNQKPKETNVV